MGTKRMERKEMFFFASMLQDVLLLWKLSQTCKNTSRPTSISLLFIFHLQENGQNIEPLFIVG
jgi:hypothetical protein